MCIGRFLATADCPKNNHTYTYTYKYKGGDYNVDVNFINTKHITSFDIRTLILHVGDFLVTSKVASLVYEDYKLANSKEQIPEIALRPPTYTLKSFLLPSKIDISYLDKEKGYSFDFTGKKISTIEQIYDYYILINLSNKFGVSLLAKILAIIAYTSVFKRSTRLKSF